MFILLAMAKNKYDNLIALGLAAIFSSFAFFSCSDSSSVRGIESERLFSLDYGKFDSQIDLFSISSVGNINTFLAMRDGFFYIANGESQKIMEMNSYGDLLTLFFNEESGLVPDLELSEDSVDTTRKAISYPFNILGPIAVDSQKTVYVVDSLPPEQQVFGTDENLLFRQVVLRFSSDGKVLDYIGQQGVGGTPFPYIRKIYATENDELVVVCLTNEGMRVYWFDSQGHLLYVVPIRDSEIPNPFADQSATPMHLSAENVIPSSDEHILFIKVDYFALSVDQDSKVQSGIEYTNTLLYPFYVVYGSYGEPLKIPPYEEDVSDGFGKVTYMTPYEFSGVTKSGWKFFSLPVKDGYMLQIVQSGGQRILNRKIKMDNDNLLYYAFSISETGIVSALFAYPERAVVEWWRIDSLIENLNED